MAKEEKILEHYASEAKKHGLEGTSTIQDMRTRRLEIDAIFSQLSGGKRILEVGCGNGFVAEEIVKVFSVELDAIDFSPELIELAKQRNISNAKGRVQFAQQDILKLTKEKEYDLIFTERCLQNLVSWEDQKVGLANIIRALKPNGIFIMLECFLTGLNNLNEARQELDLPMIDSPWHNVFFNEQETKAYLTSLGCSYIDQSCFLSGYYFGSRILLPALMPEGKSVASKSRLNDYFCALPPHGDFCPMKILKFKKNAF